MYCPGCGTEVRAEQKYCMECGHELPARRAADLPIVGSADEPSEGVRDEVGAAMDRMRDGRPLTARSAPPWAAPTERAAESVPPGRGPEVGDDRGSADATESADTESHWGRVVDPMLVGPASAGEPNTEERVFGGLAPAGAPPWPNDPDATTRLPTQATPDRTVELPATRVAERTPPPVVADDRGWPEEPWYDDGTGVTERARSVRFRLLVIPAVLAAAAAVVGVVSTVIEVTTDQTQVFPTGVWRVNDLGTNNTVAGLLAAGAVFLGALAWCFGVRFGAGLSGGGGLALAGWAALVVGLAEAPLHDARNSPISGTVTLTRELGYWAVAAAGALGVLVFLLSLSASGDGGRRGLDPWIAALGAASVLVGAAGPLIPVGTVDVSANYDATALGVDLPQMFFVGRLVQVALLAFSGIVGFLLVRRYGLGLAVGGATAAGFQVVTAATKQTDFPIGLAYTNPGATSFVPHAVTTVGLALAGFFALVAMVMALLDRNA